MTDSPRHSPLPWSISGVRAKVKVGGVETDSHVILDANGEQIGLLYYSPKYHREMYGNALLLKERMK